MIETLVQVHNKDQVIKFTEKSCNYFCVTTSFLSNAIEHSSSLSEIIEIGKVIDRTNSKIGLMINRLMMESEFLEFENHFKSIIKEVTFDFYIVSDVGVLFYIQSQSNTPIYFHSETTIANVNDATILLKNGASKIMPARELTLDKKLDISNELKDKIMLPVFGYQIMSKSYRPLLTNYFNQVNSERQPKYKKYYFKEQNRDQYYIGYEDDHGFSMFTDHVVHLIDEKELLEKNNCKFGWIDSSFIEDELIGEVIAYFHDRISKEQMLSLLHDYSSTYTFNKGLNYNDTSLSKEKTI